MTVETTLNRKTYTGDNVSTSFDTTFVFFDTSNLEVRVTDNATGVATLLVESTSYTVSGGDGAAGTVSLAGGSAPHGALLSGTTLVILRVLPITQGVDFVNNDNSDAEVAERALDQLTMVEQQLQETLDRAITFPAGDVSGTTTEVPDVTTRSGRLLGFDATGLLTTFIVEIGTSIVDLASSIGSSLIGFIQAGVGAVLRTIQSKLRDTVSVKDFGAVGDGATNDTAAIQAAITSLSSGGTVYFPAGTYKVTSTITIANSSTVLKGARARATTISFLPSIAGAVFSFTAGAAILSYCGIEDMEFTSTDTTTAKDMIRASDVSLFHVRGIVAIDNAWKGGTSVGIRLRGREEIRIRDCQLYTDKPIVVEANPNFATYMLDHSSVESSVLVVTAALTNACIDFTGSGAITSFACKRVAFVRGAGAIKCNLSAATASQVFEIENCRNEQTAGAAQFAYDFSNSGGGIIQGLSIKNSLTDPALGGIKLRNCNYVTISDVLLTSTTKTNLDVDATVDYLNLHNFFTQTGGTITGLALVKNLVRTGYVIGSAAGVSGLQRIIADAIPTIPTIPAGFTGLGASGTVAVDAGSSDLAGSITLSPAGAGTAGTGNLTLTFNAVYANAPVVIAIGSVGSTSWVDGPVMQTQPAAASCLIRWMNGPAATALTAGQTYKIHYVVIGK